MTKCVILKKGDLVYENASQQSVLFSVMNDPVTKDNKVIFVGECCNGEVDFLLTKGYEHYGPKLSFEPEYLSRKELNKIL